MSTKEIPGPFDGFERAAPDEPIFTLAAHDVLAAPLVREWVDRRRRAILAADLPQEKRDLELLQCTEADMVAESMVEWVKGIRPVEVIADPVKALNYSGNETSEEELAAKKIFDATRFAARMIDDSLSELLNAAQMLVDEARFSQNLRVADLRDIAEQLKEISAEITPKRPSYAHRLQS